MTADALAPEAPARRTSGTQVQRDAAMADEPSKPAVARKAVAVRNDIRVMVGGPACRNVDPDMFFPDDDTLTAAEPGKAICRRCPTEILSGCLRYALLYAVEGIWGGTTETDRNRIRDRYQLDARPITTSDSEIRTETVRSLTEQEGLSANEIATRLSVTQRTVQRHRQKVGESA